MTCSLRLMIFVAFSLVVAACGSTGMQTVSKARWQKVPSAQRGPIDEKHNQALMSATSERTAAAESLAKARRAIQESQPTPQDPNDQPLTDAAKEVDRIKSAWLKANLTWQQRRFELADRHLTVVQCERELARAEAVYEHTPGDEEFDVTGFRGQLASAQEAWYDAKPGPAEAKREVDRLQTELAAAKAKYARINAFVPEPPIAAAEGEMEAAPAAEPPAKPKPRPKP